MTSEDDTWAQTLITVTPEEDATLREISDTVTLSSPSDAPLVLDPDQITYRRSLTHRQFIDTNGSEEPPEEAEETTRQDAENQTYLQGIPIVEIPVEYADKSSQTLYMAAPCPPLKYFKDIMTSMDEASLPEMKRTNATATIFTFSPETSQTLVSEQLSARIPDEQIESQIDYIDPKEDAEMVANDVVDFVTRRAFWIIDPSQIEIDTLDEETQTSYRFDNHTHVLFLDNQMQTDLTCEPKESNTMLLSDYLRTKNMIVNYLDDCLEKGIDVAVITEDLINEIIDRCAERIRYPAKEQIAQTVATYDSNETEEDVLRKLKLGVVVDPLEASIVVVPLLDDLLQTVRDNVSTNAVEAVKNVLQMLLQRISTIITKLVELQTESQPRRIDEILEKRKKRIIESMSKKETETISTQTSVTGITEVKRIVESKEILCSVCRRPSMCRWCLTGEEIEDVPRKDTKILRTQDILLAYKPCYVVTTASKKTEDLRIVCHSETKTEPSWKSYTSSKSEDESKGTIDVLLRAKEKIEPRESFNEWSYVAEATLMKPCSIKESTSSVDRTYEDLSSVHSTATSRAVNVLRILKDTFCNREHCATSSLRAFEKDYPIKERVRAVSSSRNNAEKKIFQRGTTFCTRQTCQCYLSETSNYNESASCTESHGDGLKIIPLCLSRDSND